MELIILGEKIEVVIERKKNKNVYLRFIDEYTLQITCNSFISKHQIEKIIKRNETSITKMYLQKKKERSDSKYFKYLGKNYTPIYESNNSEIRFTTDTIYAKNEKSLQKFYHAECFRIFQNELERILPCFTNIPKFTLKVRTMKTRWGVNNFGSHTITLNSELLKKDLDLIDYVIIHELCHFYEPNHSPSFWRHVEEFYPKYKDARKRLRG